MKWGGIGVVFGKTALLGEGPRMDGWRKGNHEVHETHKKEKNWGNREVWGGTAN